MFINYPSTTTQLTGTRALPVTPFHRFVIRKFLGQWQLNDSLYSVSSYFDTWDDAMEAAQKASQMYYTQQPVYGQPLWYSPTIGTITSYIGVD